MQYWLAKTEPEEYGWDDLCAVEEALWDGIRNYTARNNLLKMKKGDPVLIYHSGKNPAIVGVALVSEEAFPDPADSSGKWYAIRLKSAYPLKHAVTLASIKKEPRFESHTLVRISRLSIHELEAADYQFILDLGEIGSNSQS